MTIIEIENNHNALVANCDKESFVYDAGLYDPDKMPKGLRKAHHTLDKAIEQCYRTKPFESDEERFEYLFKMYEEMIESEKNEKYNS